MNEIFDTKPDVAWSTSSTGSVGRFSLDEEEYAIHMDELEIDLDRKFSILDVGFTKGGSYDLTSSKVSSSRVFGVVLNGMIPEVRKIDPDAILFGMNNKNGHVDERKRLYSKIAKMYSKGSSHSHMSDWIKTANGECMVLTKTAFTGEQKSKIAELADSIPHKA